MEMQQLNELIKHPELLSNETLDDFRSLLKRYPYFQTAWILYLKNLFVCNHPSFKDELRRGALYVADLSVLFYYIEGQRFVVPKHEVSKNESDSDNGDRTLDLIDRFLSELSDRDRLSSELPLPVEPAADYTSVLLLNDDVEEKGIPLPMKGQELIDSFIEKVDAHSPTDELLNECSGEERSSEDETRDYDNDSDDDAPGQVTSETHDEEEYLTETLAKIYVKQQRYDKALEIIKKLYLKYPKKNAYFADQMRFLEKLIINAKSK